MPNDSCTHRNARDSFNAPRTAMELRQCIGGESGYGTLCRSSARMIASSSSSKLSFSTFPSSLFSVPHLEQEKQKKTSISARIDWQRDKHLDEVIQRQKKVKFVTKLKDLLVREPGMCMSLRELGKQRKKLGLTESRRLVTLLKRYSAVFDLFEEGASNMYFRLSPAAEELFLAEQKLKAEMETLLVNKIRKLLMMSIDKTLLIYKISHLKRDLGLPDDFKAILLEKYPEYFKVVELQSGPALELTSWDPELAISAWERNVESGSMNTEIRKRRPVTNMHLRKHPKNVQLKRKDVESIRRFHEMSYFSPYSEFAHIEPASKEAERHACAVVHEILSMTLEKRLNIDFLTHFRRDYKFSQQLHAMLVRHPELFYVSLKGDRHCVFLREGYERSELVNKDPLMVLREKLRMLVAQGEGAPGDATDKEDGSVDEADFIYYDLSADAVSEAGSSDIYEGLKQSMPRRPLNVVQKEEQMPALLASAERW